jgi:hypothetical protein
MTIKEVTYFIKEKKLSSRHKKQMTFYKILRVHHLLTLRESAPILKSFYFDLSHRFLDE